MAESHWFHKADWPSPGKDCQLVNSAVLILPAQHPVALVPAQMSETLWAPLRWRRVAGSAGIGGRATRALMSAKKPDLSVRAFAALRSYIDS